MLTVFQTAIVDPINCIVTLALVPGKYSLGNSVELDKYSRRI